MGKRDLCTEAEQEAIRPAAKVRAQPAHAIVAAQEFTGNPNIDYCEVNAYNTDTHKDARSVYKSYTLAGEIDFPLKLEFLEAQVGAYSIDQTSCFHISVQEARVQMAKSNWVESPCKQSWFICQSLAQLPGCYWKVHPA